MASRRALRAAGLHRATIRSRVADGRFVEILPDTFLIGVDVADAPPDLVRMAAVVSHGGGATLDGISALERWECWNRRVHRIHVSGSLARAPSTDPAVTYHRVQFPPSEVHMLDGIPTREPIAALEAVAPDATPHQLAFMIERISYVLRRPHDDVITELEQRFVRRRGSRWVGKAIKLVRAGSAGTKSATEDHLLAHIIAPFGEPLVNVRGCTEIPGYEPDFCYLKQRIIIEVDGGHHEDDPATAAADQARDDALRALGWTIVRLPWQLIWNDLTTALRAIAVASQGS